MSVTNKVEDSRCPSILYSKGFKGIETFQQVLATCNALLAWLRKAVYLKVAVLKTIFCNHSYLYRPPLRLKKSITNVYIF